ncbi:MAG: homoserine dehydrogenase [Candidatus Hydrogenedentota bacterium]
MSIGVAVIGAGVVGGGVVKTLTEIAGALRTNTGADIRLTHICEINADNLIDFNLEGVAITENVQDLFDADEVQIVCELIGGEEPAKSFILGALNAGKHVVTANKMLIAKHGIELTEAAIKNNVELRYEAAVAGGIPIIKAIREGLAANTIQSAYGILNGTCNYILSRMTYENLDFDDVLKQAQELGFAETPPDLDIEGHDTAHKCQIIASLCSGSQVNLNEIPVKGITDITAEDIADAREMGYLIKLLAVYRDIDGEIDARVHPTLVPEDHLLGSVRNEFNAIYVVSDIADATLYYGKGAGRMPTASAVVADIADIARRGNGPVPPPFRYTTEKKLRSIGRHRGQFYLRLTTTDEPGVVGQVGTILGQHGVSIASCKQRDPHGDNRVDLVIITHEALESELREALGAIDALDVVAEPTHVLHILEETH